MNTLELLSGSWAVDSRFTVPRRSLLETHLQDIGGVN